MFYIILNPGTRVTEILTDMHGFAEFFDDYDDAKAEAETWLEDEIHSGYMIVGECSDKKNHIV